VASGSLVGAAVSLVVLGVTVGAIYRYGWKKPPDVSLGGGAAADRTGDAVPNRRGGPMYEADIAPAETESVEHDSFDPVGTAVLLAAYFAVVGLAWLFMYFVEFLGNGPTVVG
jgi:hypothetical protein